MSGPESREDLTLAAPRRTSPARDQELRLAVLTGPDAGKIAKIAAAKSATVGTLPENDLILADPTVSRVHLELVAGAEGIIVRDLGSLNGTYIGNVRMQEGIVPGGTRLRIGSTMLVLDSVGSQEVRDEPIPEVAIPGLVFRSPAMLEVARAVVRLSQFGASVLIQGETGTGKEVVAHAIHRMGARSSGPFVVVDCGSLPANLVEAHLFGHERGAFTGAERRHAGAFEQAHGGTIFLDEVGELPREAQPSLLGVLERRRFRRVGGDGEVEVDVRVLSATNRDLRAEVNRAAFRSDLYYRLAAARLLLPALRERPEDVPVLASHFAAELGGPGQTVPFDDATLGEMSRHYWSGNVRELRNVVETALAMGRVQLDATPGPPRPSAPGSSAGPTSEPGGPIEEYKDARARSLGEFERAYLGRLMTATNGNASEAARIAKMDRPYLLSLLRKHGLR